MHSLEHGLERKNRLLAIERSVHSKLEEEVVQKKQLVPNLLEAQRRENILSVVVEKLKKGK